jgi:hypothetical protein
MNDRETNDCHHTPVAKVAGARHGSCRPGDRRAFLKTAGAASLGIVAASQAAWTAPAVQSKLPQIPFGKYRLSRLACGANPFNGGSHLSTFVNQEMRSYYTPEQILRTLRRCQEVGINCWQISGQVNLDVYRRFVDEGGHMYAISLGQKSEELPALAQGGCIGVAHHGEVTDRLFKTGQLDRVNEFLKRLRDTGLMVGVSTHMPAVVDAIESKGWDVDYYMTCVYERHRSEQELKELLGYVPLPVNEVYLQEDPPRMFQAMRNTKRPCLAFKILAAGRLSDRKQWVERAFRETFESIKPNDGVIVGIYDRYSDQVGENAEFVRKYGAESQA